jgi:hypothetical protein
MINFWTTENDQVELKIRSSAPNRTASVRVTVGYNGPPLAADCK